jgi:hypothetical protein
MSTWFLTIGLAFWISGSLFLLADLRREDTKFRWLDAAKFYKKAQNPFRRLLNLLKYLGAFWILLGIALFFLPNWVIEGDFQIPLYFLGFIVPLSAGIYWLNRTAKRDR